MTKAELAELEALRAENARLKTTHIQFKVSPKGGLSVYGLGRFPVTLYRGQWETLFEHVDAIKSFIKANASSLKTKD